MQPLRSGRTGRRGTVLGPVLGPVLAVVVAGVLLVAGLVVRIPAPEDGRLPGATTVQPQSGDSSALGALGRAISVGHGRLPRGRPARTPTSPEENLHTPPLRRVSSAFTNGIVMDAPVLIGDVALPWRYRIDVDLTDAVDEGSVHAGIAEWDDRPGSRWESSFAGYTTAGAAVADGLSTVFLEDRCEGLTNANSYIFTDGGLALRRYGASGTMVKEVDVGVCPRVSTPEEVRRAVRHEIGHVAGLAHLCDPGDACHQVEMGGGGLGCRTMYWQARVCQAGVDPGDLDGLAVLYPTIRPLHGPSREETTARVSFAMVRDGAAATAVVMSVDDPQVAAPAAAALAGRSGGTWVLGRPDAEQCLDGVARAEVNRALSRRGTLVLVGVWPDEACRQLADDWDLTLRTVAVDDPVTAALSLARLGPASPDLVIAGVGGDPVQPGGDAVSAASLAAWGRAPLLLTPAGALPPEVGAWLDEVRPPSVVVVGGVGAVGPAVVADLEQRGIAVRRLQGPDRVGTALALADLMRSDGRGRRVVVAPAGSPADGLGAAIVAARQDAVTLLTPAGGDPRVGAWLDRAEVAEGWAVGGPAVLPTDVLSAYGRAVG